MFTENGIAMLSGVLNSDRAIAVNISIMRIFIKLRNAFASSNTLSERVKKLENNSREMKKIFKIVFDKFDQLELKTQSYSKKRKKIGLKT